MSFLYGHSNYEEQEARTHRATRHALEVARNRYIVRDPRGRIICSDDDLAAIDWVARRKWTKAICGEIESHFDLSTERPYPAEPLFHFTLVDAKGLFRPDEDDIPVDRLKTLYRRGLQGLNYVAVIEPAYYVNIAVHTFWTQRRAIAWHAHGFTWGETKTEIDARFDALEAQGLYKPIVADFVGAHVKPIKRARLPDTLRYIFKSPRKVYRLYRYEIESHEGERLTGLKQKKSDPRPGNRVTLFRALRHQTMDGLTFAGGEGSEILRNVKRSFALTRV